MGKDLEQSGLWDPKWNFWQVLYLILVVYVIELFLGWLKIPDFLGAISGFINYALIGFGEGLLFFVAIIIFFKLIRAPLSATGLINFNWQSILYGLGGGVFLFFCVGLLGDFIIERLGTPEPQSFALVVQGADSLWQFVVLLILGGVIIPLKEEIIFRGLVFPPLRKAYGNAGGIVLTALFFGVMHFDLIRFLPLLFGGIVLTWLYAKTRILWPSIIAHGVWNMLMTILMWWQKG